MLTIELANYDPLNGHRVYMVYDFWLCESIDIWSYIVYLNLLPRLIESINGIFLILVFVNIR